MNIYIIILLMALATIIPRVAPAFFMERLKFPSWVNQWLAGIPYAVLGALIIPGIFTTTPSKPWIGAVGGGIAIILAMKNVAIGWTIVAAIISVTILQFFFW